MAYGTRGGSTLNRRAAIFVMGCAASLGAEAITTVYGSQDWYRARSEPERLWSGLLQEVKPVRSPGGRESLQFTLSTAQQLIPVYSAGVVQLLRPLAGKRIRLRGKLVDLRSEGFGQELWIGTILK